MTKKEQKQVQVQEPVQEPVQGKNEVRLVGVVVSKYFPVKDKNILVLIIATNGSSSRSNYPRVTFYGESAKEVDEEILVDRQNHPHVMVKATVETSKRIRDGVPVYHQTIVGNEIQIAPTKLESCISKVGSTPIDDVNRVSIIGEVVHVFRMGNPQFAGDKSYGYIITVKTFDEAGRFHFPKMVCFERNSAAIKDITVGNQIAAVGTIQTKPREELKPNEAAETIVCSDVTIV